MQHHLPQRCVIKCANLPGNKGIRRADHQDGGEDRPAPFAWRRQHNASRCACRRPPATLGTANARPCFNEPFLWGAEPTVPPTVLCSFSPLLHASLEAPLPNPCQKPGIPLAPCPALLPFHPETGVCSPPGTSGRDWWREMFTGATVNPCCFWEKAECAQVLTAQGVQGCEKESCTEATR